jgi:hypothetical protein
MPIGLPHAAPLLADDSLGQSDGVSSPLIVLDAFGATSQRDVGSIGTRDTFTFASHGARERSLGDTHVRPLDSLVPAGIEGATPAAHPLAPIDVHPLHRAGQDFAVNVRTLVQTPATRDAQAPGADDAAVTAVTLANGAPLPAWLHYDAQSGVLSGKPPGGVRRSGHARAARCRRQPRAPRGDDALRRPRQRRRQARRTRQGQRPRRRAARAGRAPRQALARRPVRQCAGHPARHRGAPLMTFAFARSFAHFSKRPST